MKYRFELVYQTLPMQRAQLLFESLDFVDATFGLAEAFTFTSKKDLEINFVKEQLTIALETCNCKVLKIEGGKVE